jgi:hypothetical protein
MAVDSGRSHFYALADYGRLWARMAARELLGYRHTDDGRCYMPADVAEIYDRHRDDVANTGEC